MNENAILEYIAENCPGVNAAEANGDIFFIYDPHRDLPPTHQLPFATLVTGDRYDRVSNLNRAGVYRLNIGVGKTAYRKLFGNPPSPPGESGVIETGHDFAVLDTLLPHPVYAPQSWISVLNPSQKTWEEVKTLLDETYQTAVRKYDKRAS